MKVASFTVDAALCADCALALRRFVGTMDGVEDINVDRGHIAVKFDENTIDEARLTGITRDSIEKLGYRIEE